MKKKIFIVFVFIISTLCQGQIKNLDTLLILSKLHVGEVRENLRYDWTLFAPEEIVEDKMVKSEYKFSFNDRKYDQIIGKVYVVDHEYNLEYSQTYLLFNNSYLYEDFRESLKYHSFRFKTKKGSREIYDNGYSTIFLQKGFIQGSKKFNYLLQISEFKERLFNQIVKEKEPDIAMDQQTKNALDQILNGRKDDTDKLTGKESTKIYYGSNEDANREEDKYYGHGTGMNGDGNYRLGGRSAVKKLKLNNNCSEWGIVVVKIEVNRNGEVIKAEPGVKGTTNNSPCLNEEAKLMAMKVRFNTDYNAPSKQIGTIIMHFNPED
ncbi:hypothetical protein [Gramella sp. MAR_2010_147]|uniref:hypothetical protein n=1 Tax=Gramella sp. MAR_2010_147 TaxID=1250205 RepID=UPI00087AF2C8|nr:hypothetical protein [Gramella sp. MAR_2010_147]SDS06300.1 hypothetical protein SAMN04488553_1380 [Gramella sp. MAR_2010_147]